ncbi:GCN5 family acetyltransferase [Robbsia andropogonis]|uniref:GCN5 family acetyltransferase n=1 Tax=Robbsia andropogonis TaxID=28092 RepID=A0A0F5JU60_9BURK|nr:GNAT family N-acetyltransferase [Robbsia andropogonis]KKB61185.1 GCN5 family acetyltransferase [Robbsia andropogonis]
MNVHPLVRSADIGDAMSIQSLYRQLVDDEKVNVSEQQLQEIGDDSRAQLFVCEVDDTVCGTVLVSLCLDVMYGQQPFAVVENFVVDTACRGRGIGRTLFREAENFCRTRNASKIMLLSSISRESAHRFFEGVGFRTDFKRGFVKYRSQFD